MFERPLRKSFAILLLTVSAWLASFAAVIYSFSIYGGKVYFPYVSVASERLTAVIPASCIALLSALAWALLLNFQGFRSKRKRVLAGGGANLVLIALYGVLGFIYEGTMLAPDLFFSEYNWLTIIFEVGPITSIFVTATAAVLLRFSF